jgi:hypothetical protein
MTFAVLGSAASTTAQQLGSSESSAPFLTAMAGEWDVDQTMWTGPEAKPVKLPAAIAVRRIVDGGGFLEEQMTLAGPSEESFTRTSHINRNAVDGVFEYFSIDTRAPQQMHYQSQTSDMNFNGELQFKGATFVAEQWGDKKNAAFAYRVELTPVVGNRQTLRLYLRPLEVGTPREFVAFRYEYRRRS